MKDQEEENLCLCLCGTPRVIVTLPFQIHPETPRFWGMCPLGIMDGILAGFSLLL